MASTSFEFTISLPCDDELLPLVRELSGEMSRYVGLSESEARAAGERITRLVTDRVAALGAHGDVLSLRFERPSADDSVSVELTSRAVPDEEAWAEQAGVKHRREGRLSHLRLEWRAGERT